MRKEILKKALEEKKKLSKYYFYDKDKIEILDLEALNEKKRSFQRNKTLNLIEASKKPSNMTPNYTQSEGLLGSREEQYVVLQTAQAIERYAFPTLVGVMPIELTLVYLSASKRRGEFGLDRQHSYEKRFKAIDAKMHQLHLPCGRFFEFEKQEDGSFKDLGSLGVVVKDCSYGFKESCFTISYTSTAITEHYKENRLVKIEDAHNNAINLSYENQKLKTIKNESSSYHFKYENGNVTSLKDHSGRTWYFGYDEHDALTTIALEQQVTQSYSYEENQHHLLSSINNAWGNTLVSFSYNENAELASCTQAQEQISYHWQSSNEIEKVDALEEQTFYGLDDDGLIAHINYPDGTYSSLVWEKEKRETHIRTRGGNQKVEAYDEQGRLLSISLNDKEESRYVYEGDNPNPISHTTPTETTRFRYNDQYDLIEILYEDETSISYAYTPKGQLQSITDAQGATTHYSFNEQGKVTSITDALGTKKSFSYDNLGRVIEHTSAENETQKFSYNLRDQITKSTNALDESISFSYTPTGNVKSIKDPALRVTTYVYDQYDRVSEKHSPKLFDHESLKEIEQIEHYSYNLNNTLKTITRVDKTSLNFEYDSNENITRVVATAPNGEKEALNYSYDALSNLEEATTNQHHLEILYSKKANPNIQVQNGIDVHRDYDIDDEDKLRTLSFLGETVHYNYDEFFKLESLSYNLKNINFTYDKNQALNQRAYPNETKELLKHDANYNLLSIGDETESTTYEYNKNNQLIERFNEETDKEPINYAYNKRGELSQAGEQHYTYSKAGNQTQEEQQYNNLNHLTEDSTYTYRYDARGNLENKTHKENRTKTLYSFNLFNQLIKVTKTDPQENPLEIVEYSYDALNRRVSKSITKKENDELTTLTHHYLYDEHNIVAILDDNKELLATIVHDQEIDTPLSITTHQNKPRELTIAEAYLYEEFDEESKEFLEKKRQQRTYYYHRDHQGSISKLTDERGIIVERFIYDAYGKIVEHTQGRETLNPYCYTGREFDGVGMYDLYYYRARYYDPRVGRFISSDPIEFLAGDFNFFRYVGNSPLNFRDPSGLDADLIGGLLVLAVRAIVYIGEAAASGIGRAVQAVSKIISATADPELIEDETTTKDETKAEEAIKVESKGLVIENTGDGDCGNASKNKGDCAEQLVDKHYESKGAEMFDTSGITNGSGHGLDNIGFFGDLAVVIETKANSAGMNQHQVQGGEYYHNKQNTDMKKGVEGERKGRFKSLDSDKYDKYKEAMEDKEVKYHKCRVKLEDDPSGCYGKGGNGTCKGDVTCKEWD